MSDSIGNALKDLAKETVKQTVKTPFSIVKGIPGQLAGAESEEEKARKKLEQITTHQRVKEIEREMAQIREGKQQKEEANNTSYRKALQEMASKKPKKMDEASRQAVGRAEQGRNFKG